MSGTISIDGLISGMDTTDVIRQLMVLERRPVNLLELRRDSLQAQNEAWRTINTRLYNLREAAYDLQTILTFRGRSATVTNENVLAASATTGAQTGVYNIEVSQPAKAQSVTSDGQTAAGAALGLTGTVQINGQDIEITADDTLNSIAQKINASADVGVNASVAQVGTEDYRLVLGSSATGLENEMTLVDNGDVLLNLGILNDLGEIKNEVQAAQDAVLKMNGLEISRAGNTIDDLISNVTLNLRETGTTTLMVAVDKEQVVAAAQNFVDEYNTTMNLIQTNLAYDATSKTTGALFGDSTLVHIQSRLRGFLSRVVEGVDSEVNQLGLVGLQTASGVEGAKSGLLEFNETKFREKLETNFDEIAKLFGAETVEEDKGVFTAMKDWLYEWTKTGGLITTKTGSFDTRIKDIESNIATWERRLEQKEEYYWRKFTAMETALARMRTQSNWLSAQLATLNSQWGFNRRY